MMSAVEQAEEPGSGVTYLYRHFDAAGRLLYVGISLNSVSRLRQHKDASHWFDDIRNITIERYDTRAEAMEAETKAIQTENPRHNIKDVENAAMIRLRRLIESKAELLRQTVELQPVYRLYEVANVLKIGDGKVKALIADGQLGFIKQGASKAPFVTGWQLLDYIEAMMMSAEANK